MKSLSPLATLLLVALLPLPTQAGNFADGSWQSARCGAKPTAPALALSDPEAFNRSVEAVNAYRRQINVYLDCLVAEGNVDIQLVTRAITEEQVAARAADERILAEARAADAKFGGE